MAFEVRTESFSVERDFTFDQFGLKISAANMIFSFLFVGWRFFYVPKHCRVKSHKKKKKRLSFEARMANNCEIRNQNLSKKGEKKTLENLNQQV